MKFLFAMVLIAVFIVSCKEKNDSTDHSKLVTTIDSPAGDSCAEPYLFTDKNGSVFLSWVEKKNGHSALKFAVLEDAGWSAAQTIASGDNWFVNWADYPAMASDGEGNLVAHYLERSDSGKFTYDIKLVFSNDQGKTWKDPLVLHDDGVKAEHGFVSIAPYEDKYFISWLDGRNTAGGEDHTGHDHHGQMTLRGALFSKTGIKEQDWELDNRVCDCCQTSTAVTARGPVVVYRDRSPEEIRDMAICRYDNGTWSKPNIIFPDRWKIEGCPVNGPRIDTKGNDLAMAWFSMADKSGQVKAVFSHDGGVTFGNPVHLEEGKAIGRVDLVLLDPGTALVTWLEGSSLRAARVHADGTKDPSITIAESSAARSAGFPQMTRHGESIILAWTDDQNKTIRTARLQLP